VVNVLSETQDSRHKTQDDLKFRLNSSTFKLLIIFVLLIIQLRPAMARRTVVEMTFYLLSDSATLVNSQ